MWKTLGKEGLAIKALWPTVGEEDKLLTRENKFLRDAVKDFRTKVGKAKKGWKEATILVAEEYPQFKVDALLWMQSVYDKSTGSFPATFKKDMKEWTMSNVTDKKKKGLTMQFISFMESEVRDVGETGMDTKCPFDQCAIMNESLAYIKSQLGISELNVGRVDDPDLAVPDKVSQQVTPGKPGLWMR